jgi:sec-independent protein translocase protein TatA
MLGSVLPAFLLIGLGMPELLVILVIIVLIFGTSRIASLGKGLGEGIRNFKKGIREDEDESGDEPKTS